MHQNLKSSDPNVKIGYTHAFKGISLIFNAGYSFNEFSYRYANIAEDFGRFHYQENIQFCRQSRASMYELQDHLITCLDEGYVNENEYKGLFALLENGIKALNGYIRMLKTQKEMGEAK